MKKTLLLVTLTLAFVTSAYADVVCGKIKTTLKNGKAKSKITTQTVAGTTCPKGFTVLLDTAKVAVTVQGPAGPQGIPGNTGADGADGQLRIYGNGSAGAFVKASSGPFAEENLQFSDFTVNPGVTMNVPSGTVIRCTGTFTNNGTIIVSKAARQSNMQITGGQTGLSANTNPRFAPAHPGIARSIAEFPEFGDATQSRSGGSGGLGFGSEISLQSLLLPGIYGGGAGSGGMNISGNDGGGTLVVLCAGAVVNDGTIQANGSNDTFVGSGGGGGGVIILASPTAIENTGSATISARGGTGGNFFATLPGTGAGGGGGGGLIRLIAPVISVANPASLIVAGGLPGNSGTVTGTPRSGGAGGGGSIGNGGSGATVATNGTTTGSPATAGDNGQILTTLVDPTALF